LGQAVRQVEVNAVVAFTFAANLPANNKVVGTIQLDPAYPTASTVNVPADESWVLEDIYVSAAPATDVILEALRNLLQSVFRSPPLSACIATNPARPIPKPVMFGGNDILSFVGQNLTAIGASPVTISCYVKLRRFTPH